MGLDSYASYSSRNHSLTPHDAICRDQAVEYVIRECKARGETSIVLMGNSIGGFTVASVAAELANLAKRGEANVKCTGLVLLNSAGNPSRSQTTVHTTSRSIQLKPRAALHQSAVHT